MSYWFDFEVEKAKGIRVGYFLIDVVGFLEIWGRGVQERRDGEDFASKYSYLGIFLRV